jgi:hypothetical protein
MVNLLQILVLTLIGFSENQGKGLLALDEDFNI